MAREDTHAKGGGGVSLDDEDAIQTGLFAAGPARIKESLFASYDYGGTSRNPPIVWLVVFEREGEKPYEQPYTIGKGWDVDKKGQLIAKNGQKGLPTSCNAIVHLVGSIKRACKKQGIDAPDFSSGDPHVLEGMDVVLERVPQAERQMADDRNTRRGPQGGPEKGPRTILEIVAIEEDAPKKGAKSKKVADEDDDEDEAPVKSKGKAKTEPEDEDEDTSQDEDAIEGILDALAEADGPIAYGEDLEDAIADALKAAKKKNIGALVDLATGKKFLAREEGWTFDGKKVALAKKGKR